MDLLNGEIDVEASDLLSNLRDQRVPEVITAPNIIKQEQQLANC